MLIDKSHSKKDIITLFKKHGVIIDDELCKSEIVNNIEIYIKDFRYGERIKNCTELKDFLKNKSPKQKLNSNQKMDIMLKAKKIIKWGNNNYIFNNSTYKNNIEPLNDILSIHMWGDLPTVRRACRFYNNNPHIDNHINPIITKDVQEEIHNNKMLKQKNILNLKIIKAPQDNPIIISF